MTAEAGLGLHEPEAVNNVVPRIGCVRPEEQVAFSKPHSTLVSKQVANGHLVRYIGVVHLKTWEPLINFNVPGDLPLIHQRGQKGGGECLGIRSDSKKGMLVNRSRISHFAHTVSLG